MDLSNSSFYFYFFCKQNVGFQQLRGKRPHKAARRLSCLPVINVLTFLGSYFFLSPSFPPRRVLIIGRDQQEPQRCCVCSTTPTVSTVWGLSNDRFSLEAPSMLLYCAGTIYAFKSIDHVL